MSADLNAIKARWAAATPGPWFAWDRGVGCGWYIALDPEKYRRLPPGIRTDIGRREDAEAIAHAPADIATLIQALEEVRDALDSHEMRYEYRNAERDAVANIRTVLERRMGADWLNGRETP